MNRRLVSFIPAIIWLIITFILLVIPGSDFPQAPIFNLPYFDKWVHIGMFCMLMLLWGYPFLKGNAASVHSFYIIAACIIAYGVIMELVQKLFTFQRSFDLFDIMADSVGCFIGLFWFIYKLKKEHRYIKNKPL